MKANGETGTPKRNPARSMKQRKCSHCGKFSYVRMLLSFGHYSREEWIHKECLKEATR